MMIDKYLEIYSFRRKIFIIGPCLPPIGGVSIHIERLSTYLEEQKYNVKRYCINRKNRKRMIFSVLSQKNSVLHFHSFSLRPLLVSVLFKKLMNNKIIFTDHNPRFFLTANIVNKYIFKKVLPLIDHLIFVNDHIYEEYKKNKAIPKNYTIFSGFLPPLEEEEEEIINSYHQDLLIFVEERSPLLIANAFQISFFYGTDLYGLDMCVDLVKRLKSEFPDIGMVFALANESAYPDYLEKIKKQINHSGIEDNFYFLVGQKQLWPLFKRADMMVRPTCTDGPSISIDEALYFGCSAVASDVCTRNKEAVVFQNRDILSLYRKSKEVLSGGRHEMILDNKVFNK